MEKKIIPILIPLKKVKCEAGLCNVFGAIRQTTIAVILLACLFLGVTPLFAAEKKGETSTGKKMLIVEGRGWVNLVTFPGEFVCAYKTEKKEHPKVWGVTYFPRVFANTLTRIGSGVNDVLVGPWYVLATKDATPLTRRLDLPDYVWNKE